MEVGGNGEPAVGHQQRNGVIGCQKSPHVCGQGPLALLGREL